MEGAKDLESLQGLVYFVTYSVTVPHKRPDYAEVELLWKLLLLGSNLQGSVPHSTCRGLYLIQLAGVCTSFNVSSFVIHVNILNAVPIEYSVEGMCNI